MRRFVGICALVALVLLAGCQAPTNSPSLPDRPGDGPGMSETPAPDPGEDVIGWENGVWYDDPIPVDASDGLNESELGLVVNRSMARVEYLRLVEFNRTVPVKIISREEFGNRVSNNGSTTNESRRAFENTKFEALFLIGEDEDAIDRQKNNTRNTTLGFYAPGRDRITIISDTDAPTINERTLAHELVHAFQWGAYDMGKLSGRTMEDRTAGRAVFEGEARYLDRRYDDRCSDTWDCVTPPVSGDDGSGDDGEEIHRGLVILRYFPYSDGPGLINRRYTKGGWDAVADLYANPPTSTEQVIDPRKYRIDLPTEVTIRNRSDEEWSRVRSPGSPGFESVGQPGITAMFAYPAYDDRGSRPVVPRSEFLNVENGAVDRTDPFNYDIPPANGWDGDKMYVYANESGETGYVWRLVWDSDADAEAFARAYRRLLRYWGGEPRDGAWHIPASESPFGDAFAIRIDGSTVTIVNGPTVDGLDGIHAPVKAWNSG
jgi:hypothetical protein